MQKTNIEWTDFTANPVKYRNKAGEVVWACVKCSPGCAHCYSEAIALRFERGELFNARNMEELTPFLDEKELHKMRTYKPASGKRCFIGDMTDIFGEWVPDDILNHLFSNVLEMRTDVTWQILTKRAERMQKYFSWRWGEGRIPCRNIWLGVSVEDQQRADERIPHLLNTPARVRFLSCEPLLGPVDLSHVANMAGEQYGLRDGVIDWCIIGGESGREARACYVEWVRGLVFQCDAAKVPAFVKQLGTNPCEGPGVFRRYPLKMYKGNDPDEWPDDLRVRKMPVVRASVLT